MTDTITRWIDSNAVPLDTADEARVDDVRPIAATLDDATVVALGASARVTHELSMVVPSVRLEGGSLAHWFDAVVHVRDTTPVRPLGMP